MIGPEGHPFEIQIPTRDMHKIAEFGIAAHWSYKEKGSGSADNDSRISWLRSLLDNVEGSSPREFLDSLKVDLYPDEVYRSQMIAQYEALLREEQGMADVETEIRTFDGSRRIISWNSNIIRGNGGQTVGCMFVGNDVTEQYFDFSSRDVLTRREVMPSMLTLDRRVIQQDCLCYLMERIHYEDNEQTGEMEILPEGIRRSDRPGEVLVQVIRDPKSVIKETSGGLYVLWHEGTESESLEVIEVVLKGEVKKGEKMQAAWTLSPGKIAETKPVKIDRMAY